MKEKEYKDIPWYEWRYKISKDWEVISNTYNSRDKILKHLTNSCWYKYVVLSKDNVIRRFFIHRLILLSFIWDSHLIVNHKNWIKDDNRLENLEYVTYSENATHSFRMGLQKIKWKPVSAFDFDWNLIKSFSTIAEASVEYKVHTSNIIKSIKWEYSHCWWYKWKYT